MLAARRLYPGAVIALSGSLNRNVREFYRLHADELEIVEPGRVDLEAIRRLIVVETVQPERLGRVRARRPRPRGRGRRVRPPLGRDARLGEAREPRALGRRRADDDDGRDPGRARARGDAARGHRVRPRHPRGHGLARLPGRRRSGTPRRSRGACATGPARTWSPSTCARRSRRRSARSSTRSLASLESHSVRRPRGARRAGRVADVRRRRLEPRAQDRRPHGRAGARLPRGDGRAGCSASAARACPSWTPPRSRERSGAVGTLRPPRRFTAGRSRRRGSSFSTRSRALRGRCRPRRRSCRARRGSSRPTRRSRRRWCCASAIARAGSSSGTTSAWSASSRARTSTRPSATTSRTLP